MVDDTCFEIGEFWNKLSKNGTFIGSYYSFETERSLLNDEGVAVPKERYDNTYHMFMTYTETLFRDYTPGSVFLVGGKEYVLSENKKLDIPYGADIYDVKWTPRKQAQIQELTAEREKQKKIDNSLK